ncbi:MAG: hypothetical protein KY452_08530 [Actinobacteria bacterium]|nr:hypothetical protein [Actinomycetota bacterium]
MGRCYEFGPKIVEGCDHPMTAEPSSCSCERCGAVCTGRFRGCADVWDKGPRHVAARRPGSLTSDLTSDPVDATGMSVVLAHLFERVEALEHTVTGAPDKAVQLGSLEELAERTVDELDRHRARTIERLDELAQGLERLSDRLRPLSTIPDRVEALERRASEAIDALDQRLRGLEKTVADFGPGLEDLAGKVVGLDRLLARVEVLEQAEEPVTAEALDAVHTRMELLSGRTDAVEVLPQRVDALERAAFGGGPVHHRSRSIAAELDALRSQLEVVATALDGVPRRLADVEVASARTEALERGLAGAIDMIDQLVAQLGALEWACRPLPPPDEDDPAE